MWRELLLICIMVFFRNGKMKIFYKTQFIIRGKMGLTRRKSI